MSPDIENLQRQIDLLKNDFYKNNFSAYQDFSKYSNFTFRLKVPHYASTPATGVVGEIIEVSGILYICSSANTWTKVGTQS